MIRNKFFKKTYTKLLQKEIKPLSWNDSFLYNNTFKANNTFTFLNLTHQFVDNIDWNYAEYGKLWTYNLNYFDFLNQEKIYKEEGLKLIKDYLKNEAVLKDGKEPYPISLRGINWIKFLSKNKISDTKINQFLFNDYQTLIHNLEYHLLGNHLLENGYSLLFGAYYFKDEALYKIAKRILIKELTEQILNDGAHFELSPMYHQILLHRLLDCINLLKNNLWKERELLAFLKERANQMLCWLQTVTYNNGNIPMVNDSAYDIAPSSYQLFEYGSYLNIKKKKTTLSGSGYRMFSLDHYELFVDVGNIRSEYQPGHAHSDTFNFELYVNEKPIIVDTGTSTYEKNSLRQLQRSTESHNTVKIRNINQSKVWSGFRVAERAKIVSLTEDNNIIEAAHDGYKNLKIIHTRKFITFEKEIIIEDKLSKDSNNTAKAYLHFHPDINILKKNNLLILKNENIFIDFCEGINFKISHYDYALGFNKTAKAEMIEIDFNKTLKIHIHL